MKSSTEDFQLSPTNGSLRNQSVIMFPDNHHPDFYHHTPLTVSPDRLVGKVESPLI
jgi:hypothetical protein